MNFKKFALLMGLALFLCLLFVVSYGLKNNNLSDIILIGTSLFIFLPGWLASHLIVSLFVEKTLLRLGFPVNVGGFGSTYFFNVNFYKMQNLVKRKIINITVDIFLNIFFLGYTVAFAALSFSAAQKIADSI